MRCKSHNNVNLIRWAQSGYICLQLNVSQPCRQNPVPFDQKTVKFDKHTSHTSDLMVFMNFLAFFVFSICLVLKMAKKEETCVPKLLTAVYVYIF